MSLSAVVLLFMAMLLAALLLEPLARRLRLPLSAALVAVYLRGFLKLLPILIGVLVGCIAVAIAWLLLQGAHDESWGLTLDLGLLPVLAQAYGEADARRAGRLVRQIGRQQCQKGE